MFGIGAGEFILILIVGLIVFGPSKLPEFGRSLGKLIRELKKTQASLSNAINLDESSNPVATTATSQSSNINNSVTTSSNSNVVVTKAETQTNSKVSETPITTTCTSTQQLTQIANSNPIRLDKSDNSTISSKEQFNQ